MWCCSPRRASDELLYEGKNLTTWLDLLQRRASTSSSKVDRRGGLAEYREGLAEDPPIDLGNIAEMDGKQIANLTMSSTPLKSECRLGFKHFKFFCRSAKHEMSSRKRFSKD